MISWKPNLTYRRLKQQSFITMFYKIENKLNTFLRYNKHAEHTSLNKQKHLDNFPTSHMSIYSRLVVEVMLLISIFKEQFVLVYQFTHITILNKNY